MTTVAGCAAFTDTANPEVVVLPEKFVAAGDKASVDSSPVIDRWWARFGLRLRSYGRIVTRSHNSEWSCIVGVHERKAREFNRRENEILAAALSLFSRDDWELVTVEEIANKAEVGKGTIYKHFESKDEIYARLALEFNRRLLLQIQQVDPSLPVVARFREMTRLAWDAHLSSEELHRVVLYCGRAEFRQNLPEAMVDEILAVEMATNEAINATILQGVEEGLFPRKPMALLMFGAQAAFWGAIQLIWSGYLGEPDKAKFCDEITDFILAGLIYQDRRL